MPSRNSSTRKGSAITTVPARPKKSAEEELLEAVGQMIGEAAERMPHEEFMKTAERTNQILDRAIAAHSRRRGTA